MISPELKINVKLKNKPDECNTKRDNNNLDESHMTINNSEINLKKNEIDNQFHNNNNKLEMIEEETNKYVEDLKKGTYNILVTSK